MRAHKHIKWSILILFVAFIFNDINAQDEKYKVKLSVEFNNHVGIKEYLHISGKYKVDKQYLPTQHMNVNIYREINEDSLALVGNATTNHEGWTEFSLNGLNETIEDSIIKYSYVVKIEDSDKFKKAKKNISFMKVAITAESVDHDSIKYINAKLVDAVGEPMEGEDLDLMVQRLFAPFKIGGSSYETDDNGEISVEMVDPLPGKDGILTFDIVFEGRKYGIVTYTLEAPIGAQVADESTFDQRTMWGPPGKTPIFLLVFANLLIFGIWFVIFILARNIFIISKS